MDLQKALRRHSRFPVQWPALYCGDDLVGVGTILDVSLMGCRLAGTMPPKPGLRLSVTLYPSYQDRAILVEEARVKWIADEQFGIEFVKVRTADLQWLIGYLDQAERRKSFKAIAGSGPLSEDMTSTPVSVPLLEINS